MVIRTTEEIKEELLFNKHTGRNFPKTLDFPFCDLYVEITSQIRTTEISSECILFDSVAAVNETKAFAEKDYWREDYTDEAIAKFWIFGQNGQGDLWLFDTANKVYFYDHNQAAMCKENFTALEISFEEWLQFANLNKQLDDMYEMEDEINEKQKAEYKSKLTELSSGLLRNYPFEI